MAEKNSPVKPKPISIFSVLFFALLKSIVFALLAELLLILWFSGIILLDSKATALTQVQNLLSSDQKFLPANHSLLSETISQQILNVHQMFIHCLLSLKSPFNVWNDWFLFIFMMTEIILTRIAMVVVNTPLYLMLAVLAVIDGGIQRTIRRYRGARESTFKFHRAKHLLGWMIFIPYLFILSCPIELPMPFVLCLHACLIAIVLWYMVMHFKKYI